MDDRDEVNERAVIGGNNPPPATLDETYADQLAAVQALADRGNALPVVLETEQHLADYSALIVEARRKETVLDDERTEVNRPLNDQIRVHNAFFKTSIGRLERMRDILGGRVSTYQNKLAREEREKREAEAEVRRKEAARLAEEAARAEGGAASRIAQKEAEKAEVIAQQAERKAAAEDIDMARVQTSGGTVSTRSSMGFKVPDYSKLDLRELKDSFTVADIDKAIRAHIKRNKKTKPLKGVELFDETKSSFRG